MLESLFKQSCRPETCNFIKKGTLAHVFFCEYCEIVKSTYFEEHPERLLLTILSNILYSRQSLFSHDAAFLIFWQRRIQNLAKHQGWNTLS